MGDQALAEAAAAFTAQPDLVIRRPVAIDWGFVSGVRAALDQDPGLEARTANGAIWVRPRSPRGPDQCLEAASFGGTAVSVMDRATARLAPGRCQTRLERGFCLQSRPAGVRVKTRWRRSERGLNVPDTCFVPNADSARPGARGVHLN